MTIVSVPAYAQELAVLLGHSSDPIISPFPISSTLAGTVVPGTYGPDHVYSYSESAKASYGILGTEATISGNAIGDASAQAEFADVFTVADSAGATGPFFIDFSYDLHGALTATNSSPTGPRGESYSGQSSVISLLDITNHFTNQTLSGDTSSLYTQLGGLTGDPLDTTTNIRFLTSVGASFDVGLSLTSLARIDNLSCRVGAGGCDVPGTATATSSYGNTLIVNPFRFFDLEGNELFGIKVTSASGIDYSSLVDPGPPGNAVPEPATLALLAIGIAGIGLARRRKAN